MKIEALQHFVAIAEAGSVTRAAEALMVAQPSLSRQLRQLEREFGGPLFLRVGRQLKLTPLGQRVLVRARQVLKAIEELQKVGDRAPDHPLLTLGASLTTLGGFLPRAVARFRAVRPEAELVVHTGLSQDIYDLVASGVVEVGVVSAPQNRPIIITHPLFEDRLWLIAPSHHPLAQRSEVHPQDLDGVPMVTMTARAALRQDLNALFSTFGVHPIICMEIDNVGVLQAMVAVGLGVTILPGSAHIPYLHDQQLEAIPFVAPAPEADKASVRRFSLVYLPAPLSSIAQAWVDVCQAVAAEFLGRLPNPAPPDTSPKPSRRRRRQTSPARR
ncbi:MAG: LysR family transcriptional regulator [Firmicutes bacterium]|nr:LysR family transcriptional regulator [Alicyclobacillaceae bacterium]MCL6496909.1 LysR family transcriptional regulator [Bacillota bacterium]